VKGSAWGRVLAVAFNAYRESVRERVLYNLVFFAIVMTLSGTLLSEISVGQDDKIIVDLGLAAMEVFGILIALFIGVGLVSKEIEKRSLYPLLAKPLRREELLVGKFLGLTATLLVNMSVMAAVMFATLYFAAGEVDLRLLFAVYATFLGLLVVVAIAMLFSSLGSAPVAAVATFCLVVAGRYADVIRNMTSIIPEAPGQLVRVLYHALPNFGNFDLKAEVVYGDPVVVADLVLMTLYAALWIALALGLATLAFRARDLP
jgi:ABC-type transport system involved in multi-copper enzyme maturation permease subunit